jgi:23S rRNA (adenine2030-N6)-methyltransferase
MPNYDHRVHAGNAGDLWKHFLLLEVADYLLIPDSSLAYAETHVGRPKYALSTPGDWEGGIGKCWPILPSLKNFCYFNIMAEFNPGGLRRYPGSACLVLQAAQRRRSMLQAEVWDIDPEVAKAWRRYSQIAFHLGNGFLGVRSLLDHSPPGLLLIDPPYLDPTDKNLAEKLLCLAEEKGWIALWWYMTSMDTLSHDHAKIYEIEFAGAGLDGGKWKGSVVALAGADHQLVDHLQDQADNFLKALQDRE